jgi:hypothetical protein
MLTEYSYMCSVLFAGAMCRLENLTESSDRRFLRNVSHQTAQRHVPQDRAWSCKNKFEERESEVRDWIRVVQ